ncbi:MAG: group II intron reverse transcriptase domain-containing protein [Anaerolineales bacterium]|nr:group II intron reverse transcriptase domain-containing protein [Anaerolineales bacterium]
MRKVYYNLYPRICWFSNLWAAYKQAARGKRYQPAAAAFEYNLEENLLDLEKDLLEQTYTPGAYHNFLISTPKRRLISAAPFRDRVVHHAVMNVIEPLFERQFIFDSYANRKHKGTHRALDRCTYFLRRHRYVMHLDMRQFFPSIDHQILYNILGRTISDSVVMQLIRKIIASGEGIQAKEYEMAYFPGDDLLAALRPRGLPIGNLTSQHWANVYLNELDQYAKRVLKCRAYIRYVDDVLLFADDKTTLQVWRKDIIHYLQHLRLTIHETCAQPRPVEVGVPFLGFIVFPDHRRLKRRNGIAFQRRLKANLIRRKSGEISLDEFHASLQGWINHTSTGDTWGLRQAILSSINVAGV